MFCIALRGAGEVKIPMFKLTYSLVLTFLGSLPFIMLAMLSVFPLKLTSMYDLDFIASIYSLVIICFIAGSHWGIFLKKSSARLNLFLLSNAITLIIFFGFLILTTLYFILLSVIIFIFLFLIDFYIFKKNMTSIEYLKIRFFVTTLVILSLLILFLI
jgi:hypothetical protein